MTELKHLFFGNASTWHDPNQIHEIHFLELHFLEMVEPSAKCERALV